MNRVKSLLSLLALSWALIFSAKGQTVSATLSPQVVSTGSPAEYAITIKGAQSLGQAPPTPQVPGLEFNGPSQSSQMSLMNGVMSAQIVFAWQVFGQTAGTFTIPSQAVSVNGQNFSTEARTLTIQEGPPPRQDLEPFMQINVGKNEIYVGEVVPITITAYFHNRTQLQNYEHPKLPRDNFVVKRFMRAIPSQGELNGQRYTTITFDSTLSAIREGTFDLGPAQLECQVAYPLDDQNMGRPRGFPSMFQNVQSRTVSLKGEAIKLTVKPLPTEGKPADFTGAVGKFNLTARATPLQLKVGDPISIDLQLTGQGNFDVISAPLLSNVDGWKLYDPKTTIENRAGGLEAGVVAWNQVIIPQKIHPVVPEYSFSYFDLDQNKYITTKTSPIPLQMSAPEPQAAAANEPAAKDFSVSGTALPEEQLADILTLPDQDPKLISLNSPQQSDTIFWAMQIIPAALVMGLAGVGLQRRLRAAAEAKRQANLGKPRDCGDILRDLKRSNLPRRAFYSLTNEYLHSWEHYRGKAVTESGLNGTLSRVLQRQHFICYGPAGDEATIPIPSQEQDEVISVLKQLS